MGTGVSVRSYNIRCAIYSSIPTRCHTHALKPSVRTGIAQEYPASNGSENETRKTNSWIMKLPMKVWSLRRFQVSNIVGIICKSSGTNATSRCQPWIKPGDDDTEWIVFCPGDLRVQSRPWRMTLFISVHQCSVNSHYASGPTKTLECLLTLATKGLWSMNYWKYFAKILYIRILKVWFSARGDFSMRGNPDTPDSWLEAFRSLQFGFRPF